MKKIAVLIALLILGTSTVLFYFGKSDQLQSVIIEDAAASTNPDQIKLVEILNGQVYGQVMGAAGVEADLAQEIYQAAQNVYDLAKIRSDKKIELVYDGQSGRLKSLIYKINSEDELAVEFKSVDAADATASDDSAKAGNWHAKIEAIPYKVKIKSAKGEVKTSMYEAALENNIDERAIIDLADAFQWTIDFATDPQIGDTFSMVYEERYLDGAYIMPGRILSGRYINEGQPYDVYYFKESADNEGYFDLNGNSVQKMFLKAPVQFKYISSGFTTGKRYVSAFNVATGHRAIDYAAATGTPIRSVGDGTVTFAGWSAVGYGYLTTIRHNGTYSTNYAHQSKIAVKRGQKVKQGQVIGYVGSTGFSTGPHLHYEMVKNGVKVNPLKEILPPGKALGESSRNDFSQVVRKYGDNL